jgi:tRNA pseudouridine38-40 synthase
MGSRTVQGVLEQALRKLGWQAGSLRAAGRTDAGVHALGQVIAYELSWSRGPDRLTDAINSHLPSDLAVRLTELAPSGFHPRFSALRRRYSYRLLLSGQADPRVERFAWRVWPQPDLERLAAASRLFIGEHDFGSFGRPTRPGGSTVRRLWTAEWSREGDQLCLRLEADSFLNRMVRRMVGAIMGVGRGLTEPEEIEGRIRNPGQVWPGRPAPARGLCLEEVTYPE